MQPIFSRNVDVDKIAFLNWRMSPYAEISNLLEMAEGYMVSAISLAKVCLNDNSHKQADILIFPMVTNINHGIELYLKGMIWTLNKIMETDGRIEQGHNIRQLLSTVRSKIAQYNGRISLKGFDEEVGELIGYVNELYTRIGATDKKDRLDFSRYPFDTKYEFHFYVTEMGNVEIDLENFVLRFESIFRKLHDLSSFLYHQELLKDW